MDVYKIGEVIENRSGDVGVILGHTTDGDGLPSFVVRETKKSKVEVWDEHLIKGHYESLTNNYFYEGEVVVWKGLREVKVVYSHVLDGTVCVREDSTCVRSLPKSELQRRPHKVAVKMHLYESSVGYIAMEVNRGFPVPLKAVKVGKPFTIEVDKS